MNQKQKSGTKAQVAQVQALLYMTTISLETVSTLALNMPL